MCFLILLSSSFTLCWGFFLLFFLFVSEPACKVHLWPPFAVSIWVKLHKCPGWCCTLFVECKLCTDIHYLLKGCFLSSLLCQKVYFFYRLLFSIILRRLRAVKGWNQSIFGESVMEILGLLKSFYRQFPLLSCEKTGLKGDCQKQENKSEQIWCLWLCFPHQTAEILAPGHIPQSIRSSIKMLSCYDCCTHVHGTNKGDDFSDGRICFDWANEAKGKS